MLNAKIFKMFDGNALIHFSSTQVGISSLLYKTSTAWLVPFLHALLVGCVALRNVKLMY